MNAVIARAQETVDTDLLWLDLTRTCQLDCKALCYNQSGPSGTHGDMTLTDWCRVLDDASSLGVREIRIIGGEPTLHPDAPAIIEHALGVGLPVEVSTNLVHVTANWWSLLERDGVSIATSYYSDDPAEHDGITNRPSHARTRNNIIEARRRGVEVRGSIVRVHEDQRVEQARADLERLGVTRIHIDDVRPFGNAAQGKDPDVAHLCGRCGSGAASIGPDGIVSPCVFSTWMGAVDVRTTPWPIS